MKAYFDAEYTFGRAAYDGIGFSLRDGYKAVPKARLDELRDAALKLMPPNPSWFHGPEGAINAIRAEANKLGKEDVRANPPVSLDDGIKKNTPDYLQVSKDAIASFADTSVPKALEASRAQPPAAQQPAAQQPAATGAPQVQPVSPNLTQSLPNGTNLPTDGVAATATGAPQVKPAPFFTTQPFPSSVADGQSAPAGKKDPAIQKLQLDLEKLGRSEKHHDYKTGNNNEKRFHHNPNISSESMDGIRGPLTEKAIATFREKHNLQDKPEADVFAAIHDAAEKVPNAPAKAPNKPKPRPPSGLPDAAEVDAKFAAAGLQNGGVNGDSEGQPQPPLNTNYAAGKRQQSQVTGH
jgi:hypothetical protein